MKVLILSCNTGGGHMAVAKTLQQELIKQNLYSDIKNALEFVPKSNKTFLEKGHSLMYMYTPKAYGFGYKLEEKNKGKSFFESNLKNHSKKIAKYINLNRYDIVICVHEFPAIMLTAARKKGLLNVKQYFIATDYTCSPNVEKLLMDAWFVPKGLTNDFAKHGIPSDKIVETGIPVSSWCYEDANKFVSKELLGLRDDMPLILLGAGSIGCGPLEELALILKEKSNGRFNIAVLCGHNKKLFFKLAKYADDRKLIPIAFTDKINLWMSAADIIISKAGGLSSTESATLGLPIVFLNLIPGLEEHNLKYFVNNGFGVTADGIDEICNEAINLLNDKEAYEAISQHQKKIFRENSSEKVVNYILNK